MIQETATRPEGVIEKQVAEFSRSLASRFSRRSFLGRVGGAAVAASVGTTAFALYNADAANAALSEFCGNIMSTMYCDTTWGCYCGCWNSGSCSFCDCCDKCCWCNNHGGCKSPFGAPTCCNTKEWSGGCGVASTKIICRDGFC
jgi:hypothetical protein